MAYRKRGSTRRWDAWPAPLCGAVELARRLQVTRVTVQRWCVEGKLKLGRHFTMQDGRRVFIWPRVAQDFVNQ